MTLKLRLLRSMLMTVEGTLNGQTPLSITKSTLFVISSEISGANAGADSPDRLALVVIKGIPASLTSSRLSR